MYKEQSPPPLPKTPKYNQKLSVRILTLGISLPPMNNSLDLLEGIGTISTEEYVYTYALCRYTISHKNAEVILINDNNYCQQAERAAVDS